VSAALSAPHVAVRTASADVILADWAETEDAIRILRLIDYLERVSDTLAAYPELDQARDGVSDELIALEDALGELRDKAIDAALEETPCDENAAPVYDGRSWDADDFRDYLDGIAPSVSRVMVGARTLRLGDSLC
jgi:hypothetical protein